MKESEIAIVAQVVAEQIRQRENGLRAQIAELQKRCELLERQAPAPGQKGDRGDPGPKGDRGEPGKDALEQIVIRAYDPETEYRHGDLVSKDGGIFRAVGSELVCQVDGIKDIEVEQTDERTGVLVLTLASGKQAKREFKFQSLIYKELWKEGETYDKGDGVTCYGSLWIAVKDGVETKPGDTDDWRLAVKHGRAGRPGPAGKDAR